MRYLRELSNPPPISLSLLYFSLSADDLLIEYLADVMILMILNVFIHNIVYSCLLNTRRIYVSGC